ncbi:MAG: hypothetical protein M3Z06_16015, partial [Actinomycetota bacterium]|nr:hypothetical protein [Actinomycetota bacterium]
MDSDELENASPDPLEHAAPDAELAEAQLALGRPEPAADAEDESASVEEFESEAQDAAEAAESHELLEAGQPGVPLARDEFDLDERRRRGPSADGGDGDSGGELEEAKAP